MALSKESLMEIALNAWRAKIRKDVLDAAGQLATYKAFEIESSSYLSEVEDKQMQLQFAQIVLDFALETGCNLFAELDNEDPPKLIKKPEDFIFEFESNMYLTVSWA